MLAAQVKIDYVMTRRSDHWQHTVALRTRIQCVLTSTGRQFSGSYSARNFVWDAHRPPGRDVVLHTRALFTPPEAAPGSPQEMQCSLLASTGTSPEPARFGSPALQSVGSSTNSPTFLQTYPIDDPQSASWQQPAVRYVRRGTISVLVHAVTVPRSARWLFFGGELELTTCDHNTAVCPRREWGRPGIPGTSVRTQLTASEIPGTGCGSRRISFASPAATTDLTNFIHHIGLHPHLWVKAPPGGCSLQLAARITVLSGNPVRIETGSQTRGILIIAHDTPCRQPSGRPVAAPLTC
jgi:hypothetical protein